MKSSLIDPTVVDMYPYPVEPERITPGTEATANALWERQGGNEIGAVWQMTPGVLEGVKAEETFVVISGRATIEFADGRTEEIGPGSVGVFYAEDSTRWTVHETLRKVIVKAAR